MSEILELRLFRKQPDYNFDGKNIAKPNPDWVRWRRETDPTSRWNRFSNEAGTMAFGGVTPSSGFGPKSMIDFESVGLPKILSTPHVKANTPRAMTDYFSEGMENFYGRPVRTKLKTTTTEARPSMRAFAYTGSTPMDEMRQIAKASGTTYSRAGSKSKATEEIRSIADYAARSDIAAKSKSRSTNMAKTNTISDVFSKSSASYSGAIFLGLTGISARTGIKTSARISSRTNTFTDTIQRITTKTKASSWDDLKITRWTEQPPPIIIPGLPTWSGGSSGGAEGKRRGKRGAREYIPIESSLHFFMQKKPRAAPKQRRRKI